MGKDHTLYSKVEGKVAFQHKTGNKTYITVQPTAIAAE
jgi:large subunit ribosomal protein L27